MKSPTTQHGYTTPSLRLVCAALAAAFALSACGGGGGGGGDAPAPTNPPVGTTPPTNPPAPAPTPPAPTPAPPVSGEPDVATLGDAFDNYWNKCEKPRTGVDAFGKAYPDKQGTLRDELTFLRAWADQYYLWYKDVPTSVKMADFTNPVDYFGKLRAPQDKDIYHFTYPTEEWDKLSNSGIELGYGVTWSSSGATAPRTWIASIVEPGSPAANAGLRRGDVLTMVDGVDFVNAMDDAAVAKINAALFPAAKGEQHSFTVKRGSTSVAATMQSDEVKAASVKYVKTFASPTGKVGYMSFENHNVVAERQLIDSFTTLRNEGVSDLVLDMRYNGGGLLNIASELAYMIAGPAAQGKVFERLQYNDKIEAKNTPEIIYINDKAYGFEGSTVAKGTALPSLGLRRVTILTSPSTCSASEAVINALQGVDVQVNLIGGQTCGKPYGFTPVPNCGTTYFSVEFKGVNAKGFGDYANGFTPTCAVADDMTRELGDPEEAVLKTALDYQKTGVCPTQARTSVQAMAARTLVRPRVSQIAIHTKAR